jgi:hypothetical protein
MCARAAIRCAAVCQCLGSCDILPISCLRALVDEQFVTGPGEIIETLLGQRTSSTFTCMWRRRVAEDPAATRHQDRDPGRHAGVGGRVEGCGCRQAFLERQIHAAWSGVISEWIIVRPRQCDDRWRLSVWHRIALQRQWNFFKATTLRRFHSNSISENTRTTKSFAV